LTVTKSTSLREYYFEERCFITEILNDRDVPALSIARARVEPGITTVLHSLVGLETYYILTGKGQVKIEGEPVEVTSGDLVYIEPSEPQRITNIGTEDLVFLAICSPRFTPEDYTALENI